ncbi:MAG: tRNA (adenosine(37)-N6)-threonylcarbamoyltransferase complex ATPase subunit type 1 TsaE [bacterium]
MEYKYISANVKDTIILAQNIESEKFENMVICLNGDLGSGKTLFAKAFASSLSIKENITSPTFNIVKEYDNGEMPLAHMDVYRLNENNEFGIEDYFNKGSICLIEWAEYVQDRLPSERLELNFIMIDETVRKIVIKAYGEKYISLCESVL